LNNAYDALLKLNDVKLTLGGHTCSLGSDEYNMKLSIKRADAVKNYLVKKGINADVIDVEGYGETKPAFSNDTEKERAKNRRTEVKAVYTEKK
jgi:OOP family OmpA-OmpF porin